MKHPAKLSALFLVSSWRPWPSLSTLLKAGRRVVIPLGLAGLSRVWALSAGRSPA